MKDEKEPLIGFGKGNLYRWGNDRSLISKGKEKERKKIRKFVAQRNLRPSPI